MGISEVAKKVEELLKERFDPAEVGLSIRTGIVIWVVSNRFELMDDMERQEAVWDLLEKELSPDERRAVSIVVALTAEERAFHLAGTL